MDLNKAKEVVRNEAADLYASIYDKRFAKVAHQAFVDGMVFWENVRNGKVSDEDLSKEYFDKFNELNSLG